MDIFLCHHACTSFLLAATGWLMQFKQRVRKNFFLQTQRKVNPTSTERTHILSTPLHSSVFHSAKDTWNASASLSFRRPLLFALHCGICSLGHAGLGSDLGLLWKQLSLQAAQHNSFCCVSVPVWPEPFFAVRLSVNRSRPEPQARFAAFTRCSSDTVLVASILPGNQGCKTFCIAANAADGRL